MTQFHLKFQCINVFKKSLPHQFEQIRGINWAIKIKKRFMEDFFSLLQIEGKEYEVCKDQFCAVSAVSVQRINMIKEWTELCTNETSQNNWRLLQLTPRLRKLRRLLFLLIIDLFLQSSATRTQCMVTPNSEKYKNIFKQLSISKVLKSPDLNAIVMTNET